MAKDNESELRLRFVRQTDIACLVTNKLNAFNRPAAGAKEFWLPRSLMGTVSKMKDTTDAANYDVIRFTLPDWKVEQDNLWEFVTS